MFLELLYNLHDNAVQASVSYIYIRLFITSFLFLSSCRLIFCVPINIITLVTLIVYCANTHKWNPIKWNRYSFWRDQAPLYSGCSLFATYNLFCCFTFNTWYSSIMIYMYMKCCLCTGLMLSRGAVESLLNFYGGL